jgi:hypothetical protein
VTAPFAKLQVLQHSPQEELFSVEIVYYLEKNELDLVSILSYKDSVVD